MHILYPQVDWRGNSTGYVESEFPIYPYAVALFDDNVALLAVLSYSMATIVHNHCPHLFAQLSGRRAAPRCLSTSYPKAGDG